MITSQSVLSAEQTLLEKKKYLIKVDFTTESIIHLNPMMYELNPRCNTEAGDPDNGGLAYATEEEAEEYLAEPGSLRFDGRTVTNLKTCKYCAELPDYDLA
jgi:hypothetical protein